MRNDYLRDRAMRRSGRRDYRRDYRNPYGSRGGYVTSSRGRRDRAYDRRMDYGYDSTERSRGDYRGYDRYDGYDERYDRDYEHDREYRRDYRDYAEDDMSKEYEEKLHEWIKKLKKKDRFGLSKDDVMKKAKSMSVNFDEFDENEFYAVYLMMVSDYKHIGNDPHIYLAMAKDWLMDDDVKMRGSDKVCAYLYTIVLGEDE
jgi:hypothetical protein